MQDSTRCPRCQRSNQCAARLERPLTDCWCFSESVDPKNLAALDLEPALGCLCPECLSQLRPTVEPPCA